MRNLNQFAEMTSGVVYIHAAPVALCPHVEWALSSTLNARADLKWSAQDAEPGRMRATVDWTGPVGTAARLTNALREWSGIYFEVTENPSDGVDGERFAYVPGLGLWHGQTMANGDVILSEMRLRALLDSQPDSFGLAGEIESALGTAWDEALEPYRMGGVGAEVTWLHQRVG
ncbi:MAG: DUF3145 domain-containing protein [Gordonia sp. (in: high G+C Gram-positive bacteria)]|uniref:DUF3145 domain-containing protein n=1 Tax=Gordonia sp. (in: high G+C Gram-positive bacteria) TaxID=84139 RepID=UPI0039E59C79